MIKNKQKKVIDAIEFIQKSHYVYVPEKIRDIVLEPERR